MEITLGKELIDADGLVGMVSGFRANVDRHGVDEILVGQKAPPYSERLLPPALLTLIGEERDGAIYLDLGARDWALLDESPVAGGEPASEGCGALQAGGAPLADLPTSVERSGPGLTRMEPPIIALGTGVFDRMGQRVGALRQLAVDSSSGRPLRVTVGSGPAFLESSALPGHWIAELSARGITLKFSLGEMASNSYRGHRSAPL